MNLIPSSQNHLAQSQQLPQHRHQKSVGAISKNSQLNSQVSKSGKHSKHHSSHHGHTGESNLASIRRSQQDSKSSSQKIGQQFVSPPDTQIKFGSQREHEQTEDHRGAFNTEYAQRQQEVLLQNITRQLAHRPYGPKPQSRQFGLAEIDMADIYSGSGGSRKMQSPQVLMARGMFENQLGEHEQNEASVSEQPYQGIYSKVVSDYADQHVGDDVMRLNSNPAVPGSGISEQRRLLSSEQRKSEIIGSKNKIQTDKKNARKQSQRDSKMRMKYDISNSTSREQSTLELRKRKENPNEEEDEQDITQFQKVKLKFKNAWDRFLFKPKDSFKIKWDIFVIILSIWNAIQIPMAFAFPLAFEDVAGYTYSDYIIDMCFIFDIIVNFRSCYIDSRTDELIDDPKKITKNYLKGRFWVDLVASCNFDLIFLILAPDMGDNAVTSLFGMLKLVRLLRLGRMVTYLSKSKSAKLGAQITQLIFMLLLLLHWIACVWFILAEQEKAWIPGKDLDWDETIVFTSAEKNTEYGRYQAYVILFYYACLALLGNDYVPTNTYEVMLAFVLVLVGAISVGVIIGQFSQLLSDADKAKRRKNEQYDQLTHKMTTLRVPEEIYTRITQYYEEKGKIRFISDRNVYKFFNKTIKIQLCSFQMEKEIEKFTKQLSLKLQKITKTHVKIGQKKLIDQISTISKIVFFLHDQTIVRQDALPDGFYYIIEGDVVVFQESQGDFKDYDYFEERRIVENPTGDFEDAESDMGSPMKYPMSPLDTNLSSPSPLTKKRSRLGTFEDDAFTERNTIELKPMMSITDSNVGTIDYNAPQKSFKNTKIHPGDPLNSSMNNSMRFEEKKTKWQEFKEFFTANEPEKKVQQDQIAERTIKLKKINALTAGDIFGEISLITKLRRTASVFSSTNVTTGFIPKKKFRKLIQANHEFRYQMKKYMHSYNDRMNKFLRTMIKNVPAFRTVSISSVKEIAYSLRNLTAPANECILRKGEISKKCFFVKEGAIDVMVRQKDESQPPYLMARLSKGACFNFINSFMERPSLFDYVVSSSNNMENNNGTTLLYVLEKDDFDALCKNNEELLSAKTTIRSRATEEVIKYDYDRMVYANLGQLSRAQQMKRRYESNQMLLDDAKPKNQTSLVMRILQENNNKNKNNAEDSVFQVSGSAAAVRSFKATMEKFKQSIETFKDESFYIRDMLIFQLVDDSFDKFSGYALNIDLAVMMYTGKHSSSQREMIRFYLKKNQGKIEREAAKRTIMTGDDHLSIAQLGYIARQEDDLHYNEEGDLVYQGDYTPEQSAMRQMQLFKIQQEKLNQLYQQIESNNYLMQQLRTNFTKGYNQKQKKIQTLKVTMEKNKLQNILDKKDHRMEQFSETAELMDKNIEEIIDSARKAGLDLEGRNSQEVLHAKPALLDKGQIVTRSHDKGNVTKVTETGLKTLLFSENDDPHTQAQVSQFNQKTDEVTSGPKIDFFKNTRVDNPNKRQNEEIESMNSAHQRVVSMPSGTVVNQETKYQQWFTNADQVERIIPENKFSKTQLKSSDPLEYDLQIKDSYKLPQSSVRNMAQPMGMGNRASGRLASDYSSQAESSKRVHTGEQMMRVVSDHDASEIAEKLQAIDARGFGTKVSIGTYDRDLMSPHTPQKSASKNVETLRSERGMGKHGSSALIAAGTMSFDKGTPKNNN